MHTRVEVVQKSRGAVHIGAMPFRSHVEQQTETWQTFGEYVHRFTSTEYALLAEAGVVREDDRLELIEGRIVDMPPIGSSHASYVNRLLVHFVALFHPKAIVSVQNPVQLDAYSEPQPDLMLLQPRDDFYAEHHPTSDDVLLLIEVADTSLEYDQHIKIPLYAGNGIQEVWLLNLRDQAVEVYREPSAEGYQEILILRGEQKITPQAFQDTPLTTATLLGKNMCVKKNRY